MVCILYTFLSCIVQLKANKNGYTYEWVTDGSMWVSEGKKSSTLLSQVVGEEGEQDLSDVPADFIVKDAEAVNMTCTDQFKDSKVQAIN